jgi:coenzyme F420-reducing hydrogenase delta subunit
MCQACGLCAVECPAMAISIKRFAVGDIRDRIVRLLQDAEPPVTRLEIVCSQDATSREELQDRIERVNGDVVGIIPVTCAARAEEVDMMKPFELGAQSVVVRLCHECRYRTSDERLVRRVGRTQDLLEAAGVGGEKLSVEYETLTVEKEPA